MIGFEIALTCLALNVYKEARGEPVRGQHAVALVTLNRVANSKTGQDICDVVFEPKQFSWTTTDTKNRVLLPHKHPDRKSEEWKRAYKSAFDALYMADFTGGATHYHEKKISPYWVKSFTFLGAYGNHYFYRSDDGYKHSAKRPKWGTGDCQTTGANSKTCAFSIRKADGQTDNSTKPEPKRSWWQRFIKYFWPSH